MSWAGGVLSFWLDLFERTQFPRRQGSWLWLVICLVLVVVLGLMVAWIAQQGKGRTSLLVAEEDPGDVPGNVGIGGGVAEQALRAALADRPDLAGVTVAAYEIRGEPALKIRVEPRQGVAPHRARRRSLRPGRGARRGDRQAHPGPDPHRIRRAVAVRPGRAGPLSRPRAACRWTSPLRKGLM